MPQAETQLGIRIPSDLATRLETALKERDIPKRQAVIQALEAWLAQKPPAPGIGAHKQKRPGLVAAGPGQPQKE